MNLFRSMDLYKAIVLLSLVLLPVGGWHVMSLDEEIAQCKQAISQAERPGGLLEEIGTLQKKIEVVAQNRRQTTDAISNSGAYFEGQIMLSGTGFGKNDFSPKAPREEPAKMTGKQQAMDFVVEIDWPRKDLKVPLDFIYNVIFNCESGAVRPGERGPPSVWRLRELSIVNATNETEVQRHRVPPPELNDTWFIKDMKFARREPRKR